MMTITTASSTRVNPFRVRIREKARCIFLGSLVEVWTDPETSRLGQGSHQADCLSRRLRRRAGRIGPEESRLTDVGPVRRLAAPDGRAVGHSLDSSTSTRADATSPDGDVPPETLKRRSPSTGVK